MNKTKRNKFTFIFGGLLILALVLMIPKVNSMAQNGDNVYFTEDGKVVRITYDKPKLFNKKEDNSKLAIGESDKESVSYGQIIEVDGVKERVYAIAKDGSYITEVLENVEE